MCSNQRQLQARFRGPYYQPELAQYSYWGPYGGGISELQPNCNYRWKLRTPIVVAELPCTPPPPPCAQSAKPQAPPARMPSPQTRPGAMMSGGTKKVESMPNPSPGKDANRPPSKSPDMGGEKSSGDVSGPEDDDGSDGEL